MMRKLILMLVVIVGINKSTSAQFNIDIYGNYLYAFSNDNPGHVGGGVIGEYSAAPEYAFYLGYSYYGVQPYEGFAIAEAKSFFQTPQKISMDVTYNVTLHQFFIGAKQYFAGEQYTFKDIHPWGGYVVGEIGAIFGAMKIETLDNWISSSEYDIPVANNMLEAYTDATVNLGIGCDKYLLSGTYFFARGLLNIRALNANTTGHNFKMRYWLTVQAGLRFTFGDEL